MITIDTLETELRLAADKFRLIESAPSTATQDVKNDAEGMLRKVIDMACAHTMESGYSRRSDRVKNRSFEMLGIIIGEDL